MGLCHLCWEKSSHKTTLNPDLRGYEFKQRDLKNIIAVTPFGFVLLWGMKEIRIEVAEGLHLDSNPLKWSVADVVRFIRSTDCAPLARIFLDQVTMALFMFSNMFLQQRNVGVLAIYLQVLGRILVFLCKRKTLLVPILGIQICQKVIYLTSFIVEVNFIALSFSLRIYFHPANI